MGKRKKGKQGAAHLSIIESSVEIGAKLIEHFSKWREVAPEAGCSSMVFKHLLHALMNTLGLFTFDLHQELSRVVAAVRHWSLRDNPAGLVLNMSMRKTMALTSLVSCPWNETLFT